MSVLEERRRRRTLLVAGVSAVLMLLAGGLFAIGVITLSNSQEGEAVGIDERPVVYFPATPNGVVAVPTSSGELASLVVLTLLPDGQGGSVVPVPVHADITAGLGPQRVPVNSVFDPQAVGATRDALSAMLTLTIERIEVVDEDELDSFLPAFDTLEVDLAIDANDTSGGAAVRVAEAGPVTLTRDEVLQLLSSVDRNADTTERYANDVAIWESIAALADTTPSGDVDVDADGRPTAPASISELADRLWSGPAEARGLVTSAVLPSDNPTDADVTVLDRADTNLTFAQISPGLVSTPNVGRNLRIEARFDDEQLAAEGLDRDDVTPLMVELVGRMNFLQANVVSVDTRPGAAPELTVVEVVDARLVEESEEAGPLLFGDVEVRVAETVLDGVDVIVTLGESFLDFEAERDAGDDDDVDVPPFSGGGTDTTDPATTVDDDE